MVASKVQLVVLGLVAQEPMHGYEVLERFRDRAMGSWVEVSRASVYQALKRLERRGELTGRDQEGTEGPDRRTYRITRAGRGRLQAGLAERLATAGPYETDANVALGFVHLLSPSLARKGLDAHERSVRARLETLGSSIASLEGGPGDRSAERAMLELQLALADVELTWVKRYRATI